MRPWRRAPQQQPLPLLSSDLVSSLKFLLGLHRKSHSPLRSIHFFASRESMEPSPSASPSAEIAAATPKARARPVSGISAHLQFPTRTANHSLPSEGCHVLERHHGDKG